MNSVELDVWGRRLKLEVEYDCYPGEEILQSQRDAFAALASSNRAFSSSEGAVRTYCQKTNPEDFIDYDSTNIFKYVMPTTIFVKRAEGKHVVALMCDYRFDPEHGIAVVFENEKLSDIGMQDIIL
jgi:hypothetical protein